MFATETSGLARTESCGVVRRQGLGSGIEVPPRSLPKRPEPSQSPESSGNSRRPSLHRNGWVPSVGARPKTGATAFWRGVGSATSVQGRVLPPNRSPSAPGRVSSPSPTPGGRRATRRLETPEVLPLRDASTSNDHSLRPTTHRDAPLWVVRDGRSQGFLSLSCPWG